MSNKRIDPAWLDEMKKSVKEDGEFIAALAGRLQKKERQSLSVKEQVEALIHDANYTQEVLNSNGCITMSYAAQELGIKGGPKALCAELQAAGIIYKNKRGEWMLKSQYVGHNLTTGYTTHFNGDTHHYLRWTEKGRRWLHVLVDRGLLQTTPKPKTKVDEVRADVIVPLSSNDMLLSLIERMQENFDCLVSLAKECIKENDSRGRKLLAGDIRNINDNTTIIMRKLENECYRMLAV